MLVFSSSNMKGTVVFYFPFLMLVCTSVQLIKAAVNLFLNVLLMSSGKHNREKRTSCSALLSFPAGTFVFLCETGVF